MEYEECLKSFQPEHEVGRTFQLKLGKCVEKYSLKL